GRLASFVHRWESLTSDPVVLEAVRGYMIPFTVAPPARPSCNQPTFSRLISLACDEKINRLLRKGAIYMVDPSVDQFLSTFFLIEKLSASAFDVIRQRFGQFEIDLFASILNAKCERYLSWFPDPGAWAVDAFTITWNSVFFYAFPPFILITRVLRKIVDESAEGVVVVPW
ncbi:hypothetical protein ALC57_05840, partial [Trachymyrmex cornetzi]